MENALQHRNWTSNLRVAAANAALALAAVLAPAAITTQLAQAQTLTTLHSFGGADGAHPYAGLVQGTNGDLYGTTLYGGANGGANGDGTVFKITLSGTLTTLYNFCSQSECTDGFNPYAVLVQATNGDFYGTTPYGGANAHNDVGGGEVFKIAPGGTLTTLYSFCYGSPECASGTQPKGGWSGPPVVTSTAPRSTTGPTAAEQCSKSARAAR